MKYLKKPKGSKEWYEIKESDIVFRIMIEGNNRKGIIKAYKKFVRTGKYKTSFANYKVIQ